MNPIPRLLEHCLKKARQMARKTVSTLLQKIEKTGNSSEVDDMVLVSVISTHLIYNQFIERFHENLQNITLNNLKIIEEK